LNKINGQGSSVERDTVPYIPPWTEHVGKVVDITDSDIVLETYKRISIPISGDIIAKCRITILRGDEIGILTLDDGEIRLGRIPSC
jgi:hypothetical protein